MSFDAVFGEKNVFAKYISARKFDGGDVVLVLRKFQSNLTQFKVFRI